MGLASWGIRWKRKDEPIEIYEVRIGKPGRRISGLAVLVVVLAIMNLYA